MRSDILRKFAGYVLTCKVDNTAEWMEGLANELNVVGEELDCPTVFEFDGDGIRGIGVGDEPASKKMS
jgi:hypothetical protein